MHNNHTTLHLVLIDTTEEQTDVITSLTLIQGLTEHLDTSDDRLLVLTKTEQLNLITDLALTSLNTTRSNSTTTSDREDILNRHQERLINLTDRLLNPSVNSVHQLHDLVFPLLHTIQCTQSRATDDRSILFITIRSQKILDIHLHEVDHFLIDFRIIALVEEYYQTRHVYLTSEQHVLTCLRHRTISSSNHEDSTVHLSSTSNHVLHIVGVSRAVNVSVVTLCSLILDVGSVDGDTTLFLLRSIVNLIERLHIFTCTQTLMQHLRDSCGQSSLTVVDVTNCTNVNMRFGTHINLFSHSFTFLLYKLNNQIDDSS